jgi:ankyrin repeat protein
MFILSQRRHSVQELLRAEADAFHVSHDGRFALLEAAGPGGGHPQCVELLLHAADARQAVDATGWHALLEAVSHGRLAVLKILLAGGGSRVNQADKEGNTALLLAARCVVRWCAVLPPWCQGYQSGGANYQGHVYVFSTNL